MLHGGYIGKTFLRAGVIALVLCLAHRGGAQTITKNNSGGNLNTTGDWNGGAVPGSTSIAEWTNNTGGGSFNLGNNLTWGEVKIVNPNSAVTFNAGFTLTLDGVAGVGIDMSTATQTLTINSEVILGASQTWLTGAGAGLTIGGSLSMGADQLTIGGTGNATLSGVVSGTGKLDMNSSGTLTLGSANTYSGGTVISNGVLVAKTLFETGDSSSSLGTGSLTLNGGTLRYAGASFTTANFATSIGANGGTLDNAATQTAGPIFYGGTVSGSGTLNILDSSGNGNQWLFTGTNSAFTGNINIGDGTANSGWLQVRGVTAANQVGTGTVTVNGGGTFSYDAGSAATIANPIVLNGGALGAQSASITYSGPIVISNASLIGGVQLTVGTTETLSGVVSGPGGFTTAGDNGTTTIVLGNANTFTGGVTIDSGTVELNNTLAVQNSTINDATNNALAFGTPTSYNVGGLSGAGNIGLTNSAGGIALIVGTNNASTAYSGILSGSGSLTKVGTGVLTVSGANTYSGGTTIGAGTVKLGANNAVSDTGAGNVTDNGTLDMGGFSDTVNGLSGTGIVDNSGGGTPTLTVGNNNASSTFSGVVQNTSGTLALTKAGTGTLTLAGASANTYSGVTTVSSGELDLAKTAGINAVGGSLTIAGGTVKLVNGQQLANSTVVTINSGTFNINGNSDTFDALVGTGGTITNSAAGAGSLTIGSNNGGGTYSGTIDDGAGTIGLVKNGTGTETLSGSNTFSGGTTINAGTIVAGSTTALGSGGLAMTGGTLQLSANLSLGDLSGTAGTIGIFANNTTETLTVGSDNSSTTFSGTFNQGGNANTHLALTKTGSGVLTLTGANTYNGATTIGSGGAINIQNANALGTSAVTVNSGGALQIQGGITAAQALTLNGTGVSDDGALRNTSGNNTYSGTITLGSATRINSDSGTLTIGSSITGGNFGLTVGGAGNVDFSAAIPSTITTLTKDGTGILILANASDAYTGDTTISAGTLRLGASNVLPNGAGVGNVNVNGGTLDMAGFSDSINGLNGGGTVDNSTGTGNTLTVGNNNASSTFSGVVQNTTGTLSLTKTGTGTLTLSGNNTFSGVLTIQAGTLAVSTINNTNTAGPLGESTNAVTLGGASTAGTFEYTGGTASSTKGFTLGNDGGAIQVAGAGTVLTLSGQIQQNSVNNGQQLLTETGPGTLVLSGATDNVDLGLVVSNGTVVLAKTSSGTVHAVGFGGASVLAGGILQLGGTGGDQIYDQATISVSSGIFDLNGKSETVAATVIGSAGLLTNGVNGAALSGGITNNGAIFVSANTYFNGPVTNTGAMFFQGAISNTLVNSGNGTVTLDNTVTITQTAAINGGTLNLNGQTMSNGLLLVGGTGVVTNGTAGATVNGGVSNANVIAVTASTFFNGPVTNTGAMFFQGAISNSLVNRGSFNLNNNGTLTVAPANSGTINVAASTLTVNPAWANSGTVQLGGGVLAGGNLTNNSGASVAGFGTISNQLVNAGVVTATNGNLNLVGAANGSGTYRAVAGTSASTLTFVNGGSVGSLFNTNATIQVDGALTNTSLFVNEGTLIVAGGAYQTAANLTNAAGAMIANSGAGSINAAAVFNLGTILATNATFTISNLVAQGGTVTIGAGGTLTLPGASSLTNFGTINLQGASGNNAVLNLAGAVLTNQSSGTITGGGIIQNAAQVVNLLGGSILATSTTVELQFTNANTFGNAGTIGATTGATLTFGAAGVGSAIITNYGTINLARGTLRSGAITNLANGFFGGTGVVTAVVVNQGRMNFSGTISNGLQNSGSFTLNDDTTVTSNIVVNSGGVLDLVGNNLTNNVVLTIGSGGVLTNGGAANAGATVIGGVTNGGTVYITANTYIDGTVTNTGAFFYQGVISNNLVNSGSGTVTLNNTATITQTANINSGTLNLNGQTMANGLLLVNGTGVVTNGVAGATVNGGVSNANVIAVTANTYFNGPVTNTGGFFFQGAISNNLVNSGSFDVNGNGTITGSAINTGTFNVNNGDTLTVIPAWANSGTILIAGGTVAGGTLTNASGAVMNGSGNLASLLVNNGLLIVTNGTLTVTIAPQQNGLVNVADGGAPGTLSVTPAWNNNGTVSIASGGAVTGGNFTNLASGTVTNLGSINTLLVNQGRSIMGGLVSNFQQTSGTNTVSGSGTVSGTATVSGGLFDLNGGTYSNGLMVVSGTGSLTSSQANATFNGGLSNAATASFAQNVYFNGTITNTGAFLWQGAISNNFVNAGNGTVTLNNTATITKTASINGGTFNLNGQTYSNGLMVLGGTAVLTNSLAGATFNGGLSNDATVAVTANTFFNGPVTNTGAFYLQGAVSNSFVNTETATLTINNGATITGPLVNAVGNQVNINNGTLQLLSAPTQNGTLTIASTGVLSVPVDWSNGGTIVVSGGAINSGNLTNLSGAALTGFATLSNAVINSSGALITANGGTLTLVKGLTQNGGLAVNSSAVLQVVPDWVNNGTVNIAAGGVVDGGNLTNTSAGTLSGAGVINSFVVNQGRMNWGGTINNNFLQTAGSFTLSGNATITGGATINGGAVDLTGDRLTDGSLAIATGATLTNSVQNATLVGGITNAGTVNLFRDTYVNGPVTNTGTWIQRGAISNSVVNSGVMAFYTNSINVRVTGSIVNSGSLTFDTNGTVYVSGVVSNSGSFAFSDVISNNLVNTAGGSIILNGAGTVTGSTMVNGGTFNLNGQSFTDALMVVSGTGVLTNSVAGATVSGGLSNDATVAVTANTYFKGPVTNTGNFFFQGAISNTFVSSDTAKLNGAGTITGTASITGGSFDLNGKSLASSQMIVTSAGVLTNSVAGASMSGAVTLQNSMLTGQLVTNNATLSGSGTISAPLNNTAAGVILANNGLLTITGALTQNGTIEVTTGNTLDVPQAFSESGSLIMQGGFVEGGTMTVTTGDNITGFGTISNDIVNAGLITATGGTLTLAGGAPTTQAGSGINIASGGTLSVTPDWANSGTLTVSGTLIGGTVTNTSNTGTLSGTGTIDTFVVNQGRMNWGGTINNSLLETAGSLTLSGNATITGNATISGGGFDLVNNLLTAGLLTINNGATMQNSGGVGTITANVVNNGTVNFNLNDAFDDSHVVINGQVVNNGTWSEAGIINGTLVNTSSFDWTSHTYFFGFDTETSPILNGGITNTGSLTFEPAYVAQVNGSVTNSGAIGFNGTVSGNLWQTGGTFTLNGAGTISGPANVAGGSFNLNGETYNGSTMTVSGTGALTNAVANANFNSVLSNAANVGVTANTYFKGAVNNTGTFAFMGAVSNTFVNSGDVVLNGSGTISGALANSGSVNVNNGTLSLVVAPTQTGTITVNNGATLNVAQAWVNNGTISMLGGVVTNAAITNANFVTGYGTIDGSGVVNNGKIFANAGSLSGNGTLTVRLTSFTNNSSATIGTASSNAVLNIVQAGNILINQGTVSLSGGTIDFNGGSGTITNFNIIAGVGNVANFPIINAGTLASFVAQAPIPGLSNLIATIGITNNGLLGANNLINGAATLSLTVSGGGAAIVNQGTVAMQGGFITINGGSGVITNVNNGLVYGIGTQNLTVANLATGKILASNGVFSLNLQSNANAGVLSNLNTASTIQLTDTFLKNSGTIVLNGGGLLMNGTITNESSITGPGAIVSSLYNDTPGVVLVTNGLLNVATNAGETVQNLGLFTITSDGTLDVVSSWVNTNGTVTILGGGLMGGAVTNVGLVSGFGTISSQLVNMGGGTLTASGAGSLTLVAAPTQNGWVNIANAGTLNVDQAWLNGGFVDLQGGSLVGSTVTNSGTIFGSGTITTQVRNNGGGTVTANGGTLTLSVAPNQLGSIIISNAATLNVLQAWQNSGTLNLQGGTAIGSTIANASTITGFGTITPQVQNAGGGVVTPNGGTLTLTVAPSQLGTFAVNNGGTLNVQQAWQNGGLLSMSGGTAIGSTITNASNVSGFGTITPQLVNNVGATVTANGGTLTLTVAPVQLGSLVISNAATLNALQAWQNSGSMKMRGGTVIGSGITNAGSLEGFGTINPQMVNNAGATLTADSGLLTLALALMQNGTVVVTNGGTLNVLSAWKNNGTISMLGGNITGSTVTNTGTMTGFGGVQSIVNNDLIFVTNGTLQAAASFTQNGTVSIATNTQLAVTPTWVNNGTILLNGGFTSGSAMTNAASGSLDGFGTISNAVVNAGSLVVTNGTLNLVGTLTQSATLTVANAATLNSVLDWQNGGFLSLLGGTVAGGQLTNAGSVSGFGTFSPSVINNSGATITASGGGTLILTAIPFQNGVVNILGTLNVASAWSNGNAGTVSINGGVLTGGAFTVDGTVGGNGTIAANMIVGSGKTVTVSGGTLNVTALTTMNGGAINSGNLVNYGTISGNGTIGSTLSNPGYVRATNGLLYVQALSGNQATGTLEASAGGTLDANGVTPWLNNGQVILSGGTVIGGDISNNTSHIISGYGTIAPNVYNSGQILANNAGQALTLNSSLVNLSGGSVTANNGNLVVNGAFVNQGTLAMANSMGTFAGTVVNSGAWITDPTTNIFQNTYTLTSSGYIQASAGDVYVFTNNGSQVASFVNQSAQSNAFNTVTAKFVFSASLSLTQTMYAAGSNIGNLSVSGGFAPVLVGIAATNALFQFESNFALGTLEIGSTTEVAAADVDGGVEPGGSESALFVDNLDLDPGAQLIISNNVQIYFITSNAFSSSQVTLLGNAGLHLLTSDASLVVPEPTVVLLWLSSIATLYAARKRGAGRNKK